MTDPIRKGFIDKISVLIQQAKDEVTHIGIMPSELFGAYMDEYFSHDFNLAVKTLNSLSGYEGLEITKLKIFCGHIEQARNRLSVIKSWLSQKDITQNYNHQIKQFKHNVDQCLKILNPDEYTKNLEKTVTKQRQASEKTKVELKQTQAEANDEAFAESSEFFKNLADKNQKSALFWGVMTLFFVYVTGLQGYEILQIALENNPPINEKAKFAFYRLSGATVFLLSFLLTATFWCARMYKTFTHLHTINRHKQTTLSVTNKLIAGEQNDTVKAAIATHAAESIFADPQTGLITDKSSSHSASLNIGDLAKISGKD